MTLLTSIVATVELCVIGQLWVLLIMLLNPDAVFDLEGCLELDHISLAGCVSLSARNPVAPNAF